MDTDYIAKANADLRNKPALEVVKWANAQAKGRAIVSTNFRPYEAVPLHPLTQVKPDIPVLWGDNGYNRPPSKKKAKNPKALPKLTIKPYRPGSRPRSTTPSTVACPNRRPK